MAYCIKSLNGINVDCEPSMGGLKVVYIANYGDIESITYTEDNDPSDNAGKVTAITMVDNAKFKGYYFRRNTASMTSTLSVDPANGTSVATDVTLSFLKQDTQKRIEISALSIGELAMIVVDANGRYWFLGKDMPVMASAGGAESGTAYTDGNRYTITLQDNSKDYPWEILIAESSTGTGVYIPSIVTDPE